MLRHNGVITTVSDSFKQFDQTKIDFLLANGLLLPLQYNCNKYARFRLFKSYLIRKIKRKTTNKPYKKSHLMIQDYNDIEKIGLLTQHHTIQRYSQCLLLSFTPAL